MLPVIALYACAHPSAGDTLSGPVLGLVADLQRHALRPIRGIPGAASFADPIDLGADVTAIFVVPHQSRAFVLGGGGTSIVSLAPDGSVTRSDSGLPTDFRPTVIAFSPTGAASAFYDPASGNLWLKKDNPQLVDTSQMAGPLQLLAPGERVDVPLAVTVRGDSQSVIVFDGQGGYRSISGFTNVTDIAFVGSGSDLAVADSGAKQVLLVHSADANSSPDILLDLSGAPDVPFHIASSADGALLAVLAAGNNTRGAADGGDADPQGQHTPVLGLLRIADRTWNPVECACTPSMLVSLNGNAVYSLTGSVDQPLWVLDGDAPSAQVVFVPAVVQ